MHHHECNHAQKYKSKALAALHETVSDLHKIDLIATKAMRHFEESCLVPVENLAQGQTIETSNKAGVSQAVFAHYLNVYVGLVSK